MEQRHLPLSSFRHQLRLSSTSLFLSLFSLLPFLHSNRSSAPLLSGTPPHLPTASWPFSSLPLRPCLIKSACFISCSFFPTTPPLPFPLHTIQPCNHIIKQHYCICNYARIISRWTAPAPFRSHPWTSEVRLSRLNEMSDGEVGGNSVADLFRGGRSLHSGLTWCF